MPLHTFITAATPKFKILKSERNPLPPFHSVPSSLTIASDSMISESSLRNIDVQDRRLSIIDVSSADDSLLDPISENHHHLENQDHVSYTPNSKKFEDAASKIEEWEREPYSIETSEKEKPKRSTKCNLRKSLAWDSAFFTSAGVLDPEELSSIIEGVEKEEKHDLPVIQEDVYKSCESISTLGSDTTLTLESIEGDLFEDIRASIQKSSKKSDIPSGKNKVPPAVARFKTDESSKRLGMAPHNKMKAPPASKNSSAGMQGLGKMTKKNPIFQQLPQPVATRRESSILKHSRVSVKSSPSSTISSKRVSLGDQHVKSEKDKAKRIIGDRVSSLSKASVVGGSRGTVPKPMPSSRSPSGSTVSTKTKSVTSASPAVRTPSRIASRNKTESGKSSLSGLISVTRPSSCISPASSISDWSSESSSSTSLAKQICNSSRTSLESCSSRKICSDTDADQGTYAHIPQSDSSFEGHETHHPGFINQAAKAAPGGTVLPQAPMKPSGLRLPSPKIGFFDGVKSSVRTPCGGMQPRCLVPRSLPKHGVRSPNEVNKAKLANLQSTRSISSTEKTKPNNKQNSHPNSLQESSDVAVKTSSALLSVKSSGDIPKEVQNEMHLKVGAGAVKNSFPSHVVVFQHDVINSLDSLKDVNCQENSHFDSLKDVNYQENSHVNNQVDFLSKQVASMDINFRTQEKLSHDSLSFSQNDTSSQYKFHGLELSRHEELIVCPEKEELKDSSTPSLSFYPTSFDMTASVRRPLAIKDSICNMDGIVSTESQVSEVKPTLSPVLESFTKENN